MYRYTGVEFARFYLASKSKRLVWQAYMADCLWICDFADLREAYHKLFDRWGDDSCWGYSSSFFDNHY